MRTVTFGITRSLLDAVNFFPVMPRPVPTNADDEMPTF